MINNNNKARPLYIECGTTIHSPVNTGIQRVVRNIIKSSSEAAHKFGFDCELVAFENRGFVSVHVETNHSNENVEQQPEFKASIKALAIVVDQILTKISPFGLYQYFRNRYKHLIRKLWTTAKPQHSVTLASATPGNKPPVLLLLDSTWNNAIWPHVDSFRKNGGLVCAVLYDLIPFIHPDTVAETTRIAHTSWWSQAPLHVDAIMCISQSVQQNYLDWQAERSLANPLSAENVGYFYLGSELADSDPVVRLLTEREPFFLMVGSLEPRKNHQTVLDAFEQLWAKGVAVRLAVVGAFGWKSEKLLERIQNHSQLSRQLFLIRDASDRDLTGLYSKTTGLILASLAEGFGLPIVEAYQRGAAVICSDIPVFREVAGGRARYFEVLNPASLADQVLARMQEKEHTCMRLEAETQPWINWRESTEQLLDKVSRIDK
jgi:alpha-1,2-rhamnosyltransferase